MLTRFLFPITGTKTFSSLILLWCYHSRNKLNLHKTITLFALYPLYHVKLSLYYHASCAQLTDCNLPVMHSHQTTFPIAAIWLMIPFKLSLQTLNNVSAYLERDIILRQCTTDYHQTTKRMHMRD